MSASSTNARAYADATLQRHVTFNKRVTQSVSLADDASFQFDDVPDLDTIHMFLKHTPHGVVNRVAVR